MTAQIIFPPTPGEDPELDRVESRLLELDPSGDRVAQVIRNTLDQLYDGQHTGRWSFDALHKTEKTHMGTLVEINLHREFGFEDGDATDYRIAGVQVDCKYSMTANWTLPPEVVGHVALLLNADDASSTWGAGIMRIEEHWLNPGRNRDAKGTLSKAGKQRIRRLWANHGRLPENLLLHLDPDVRQQIFKASAKRGDRHGQARTNELFRQVQQRIVRRTDVATVAQQDDFMKRARGNGGARDALQPEGILVLGHQENDPLVAAALGLPIPKKGEFVSARVVRARPDRNDPVAEINGEPWALARPGDDIKPGPELTKRSYAR